MPSGRAHELRGPTAEIALLGDVPREIGGRLICLPGRLAFAGHFEEMGTHRQRVVIAR